MQLIEMKLNSTKRKGKCLTRGCHNTPKGTFCPTCYVRHWRLNNLVKYCYNNLKGNAKRRGMEFTITVEDFKAFCYQYNYIGGRGRSMEGLTVDRIDQDKGYIPGNLQALTNKENIEKYLHYDYQRKLAHVSTRTKIIDSEPDIF